MLPCQEIDRAEFVRARTVEFAPEFFEFQTFPRDHVWTIRNVLPVNFEAYCAIITPWDAYLEGERYHFKGLREAYTFFGRPVPEPLTLDQWHAAFQIIEDVREFPPPLREGLDRFARAAEIMFVRCFYDPGEFSWRVDRRLFLESPEPFEELPMNLGDFQVFPEGVAWYLHHRDDEPILYLAAERALVTELQSALEDRIIPLTLDDRYY